MDSAITIFGSFVVTLLGLVSGLLLFNAYKDFTQGHMKDLTKWLSLSVLLCGFPYALWTFLMEAELVYIADPFLRQLPGTILVGFFFVFMLKASLIISHMGKEFNFK